MKRREFITLLGGAQAWPIVARAQQWGMPVPGLESPVNTFLIAGINRSNSARWRRAIGDRYSFNRSPI
jgi:hypothetical protein